MFSELDFHLLNRAIVCVKLGLITILNHKNRKTFNHWKAKVLSISMKLWNWIACL